MAGKPPQKRLHITWTLVDSNPPKRAGSDNHDPFPPSGRGRKRNGAMRRDGGREHGTQDKQEQQHEEEDKTKEAPTQSQPHTFLALPRFFSLVFVVLVLFNRCTQPIN